MQRNQTAYNRYGRRDKMSRDSEKVLKELQKFLDAHAEDTENEADVDALAERFFAEYNLKCKEQKESAPETADDYLDLAEQVTSKKKSVEYLHKALELEPDTPVSHGCGSCRRCADLCPTGAIMENGQVDAGRCLSYWTIEHRGSIPEEIRPLVGTRLYGCDTCVTVCPWNGKPLPEADERFRMSRLLASIPLRDLLALDAGGFADLFRNSPLKRIKREGLLRNGCIVLGNAGTPDDIDFLKALSGESPLVAEHASWAVERILRRHGRHACSSGARD